MNSVSGANNNQNANADNFNPPSKKQKTSKFSSNDTSNDTKSNKESLSENREMENTVDIGFQKCISKNVTTVLNRINLTTPVHMPPKYDRSTCMTSGRPLNKGTKTNSNIRVLIDCAMDHKQLAQMPANWQSWL